MPSAATPLAPGPFRRDVQGLRAVAVGVVVLDHVVGWPRGGFVGVDVFFVISGFLITQLLLREAERTGRISLRGFFARRIRRILPLAALTLGATVVASSAVFNAARAASTSVDALWAALFAANVHFQAVETDYFQNQGPVSPLQHFWSLSVEEQFYFVWPLVIGITALLVARRAPARLRLVLGLVMTVVVIASFAAAIASNTGDPRGAYFSTATRAWELGAGALLAVAGPLIGRIPRVVRPALLWGGLAGIAASSLLLDASLPFPGPWAAAPVAAACLVIASGTGSPRPLACPPLTNRVSGYLGDISYALYLCHFPVTVILRETVRDTVLRAAATLVVSLGIAVVLHHLVEVPLIRSPLLAAHDTPLQRRRSWVHWARSEGPSMRRAGLGALTLATVLLVAGVLWPQGGPSVPTLPPEVAALAAGGSSTPAAGAGPADGSPPAPEATAGATAGSTPGSSAGSTPAPSDPATTALQADVRAALQATSWPPLKPSLDSVLDGSRPGSDLLRCGSADELHLTQADCTWSAPAAKGAPAPEPKHVVLVGDSTAMHYLDALVPLAEAAGSGWSLSNRAMFACPFLATAIRNAQAGITASCAAHNRATLTYLAAEKPDIVIITNSYQELVDDGTGSPITTAAWSTAFDTEVTAVEHSGARPLLLAPPPDGADIASCYRPGSTPADCLTRTSKTWLTRFASDRRDVELHGGAAIDPRPWLCVTDLCPAFIGETPVKEDRVHLTTAFAVALSPALGESLRDAGYLSTISP